MTQTAPAYTEMSKSDLIGIIETQQKVIQRFYRLLPVQNKILAPGEKLAWAAARPLIDKEKPDEHGLVRIPINEIAEQIGMSASSASRYIANMCERFDATHEEVPYTTKKGQQCNLTYIDPTDLLWTTYPDELPLPPEKERTINGNECPHCRSRGTLQVKKRRIKEQDVVTCGACGYKKIYPVADGPDDPLEPMEYRPPKIGEEEKGPQAGEPFGNAADVVDAAAEKDQTSAPPTCTQSPVQHSSDAENEKGPQAGEPFGGDGILPELKNRRIWACWRYEGEEGKEKPTKVPYIADLLGTRRASNTNQSTWRTYEAAVACYEKSQSWDASETSEKKPFDGIGFMCDSTFTFIDQDHCRNPETGEITQEAMGRARAINSYTEPSISGDGLHTYAWDNLPPGRRRDSTLGVEMYDRARFCVFTGTPLPDFPHTMEKRGEQLLALHSAIFPPRNDTSEMGPLWENDTSCDLEDEEIIEKALAGRSGAKFTLLWRGEWKKVVDDQGNQKYPSQSEADGALCHMLARVIGKVPDAIDRLFRKSGLMRPKWERADYRASTMRCVFGGEVSA